MKTFLLYPDKEWEKPQFYYDEKNISEDLGLNLLYNVAAQKVIYEYDRVKELAAPDIFIKDVMKKVIMTPLLSEKEIMYRQSIIKDCLKNEAFMTALYALSSKMLKEWEKLGRFVNGQNIGRDSVSKMITRIHEFLLFTKTLSDMRLIINDNKESLSSEGLLNLVTRFDEAYSEELERKLKEISKKISFYINDEEKTTDKIMVDLPEITFECGVSPTCRLSDFKFLNIDTKTVKYRDPNSTIAKVQGYFELRAADTIPTEVEPNSKNQASSIELQTVRYVMTYVEPFMHEFEKFFDDLHFQTAFYVGAINLSHQIKRFNLDYCYPKVCEKKNLRFADLKEFVMCIGQRVEAVGNTCNIEDKNMIIITGANQGGKSTFLRSIGIAQVMFQCGLMVAATRYESGIFPSLFMHFTRREDSEMNSGRLDEELRRMDQIVKNLGPDSLILLNESFATTTEKDGSEIAYGILKALNEAGVKIISVTHLLSFAQRMYKESEESEQKGVHSDITFFSAERLKDGKRTYKMVQTVPELTSFGLDLYDRIVLGEDN